MRRNVRKEQRSAFGGKISQNTNDLFRGKIVQKTKDFWGHVPKYGTIVNPTLLMYEQYAKFPTTHYIAK